MSTDEFRSYTLATAKVLGIELDDDEIDPVATQVERVALLVEQLPRVEDDESTMAPRFRP